MVLFWSGCCTKNILNYKLNPGSMLTACLLPGSFHESIQTPNDVHRLEAIAALPPLKERSSPAKISSDRLRPRVACEVWRFLHREATQSWLQSMLSSLKRPHSPGGLVFVEIRGVHLGLVRVMTLVIQFLGDHFPASHPRPMSPASVACCN